MCELSVGQERNIVS